MVTAKQVINSIKPNITKAPQGQTQKGSAGYDNPREDIEKIKGLREGSIQKVPVNADDITNKAYVDAQFPVTHASTTGQTANDHHVAFVKADADLLYGDIALEHGVNDVNSSSATAAQGALADTALQTETFVAATHTAIGDAAPHHSVNAANTTYTNLVNDSMADALHRHSELSASDGTPNPALSVDATGNVGIGTTGPGEKLTVIGGALIGDGPELVTNGGFDSDTGWNKGTGWTIAGGVAHSDGSQVAVSYLINTDTAGVIDTYYRFKYTISNYVSGVVRLDRLGDSVLHGANGIYVGTVKCTDSGDLYFTASEDFIGDIDDVSVKEVMDFYVGDNGTRFVVKNTGNVGIGTTAPSEKLDVNSDAIRIRTAQTPASAGATGDTGMVCWDANYIYVCVATNTWKRSAIATW